MFAGDYLADHENRGDTRCAKGGFVRNHDVAQHPPPKLAAAFHLSKCGEHQMRYLSCFFTGGVAWNESVFHTNCRIFQRKKRGRKEETCRYRWTPMSVRSVTKCIDGCVRNYWLQFEINDPRDQNMLENTATNTTSKTTELILQTDWSRHTCHSILDCPPNRKQVRKSLQRLVYLPPLLRFIWSQLVDPKGLIHFKMHTHTHTNDVLSPRKCTEYVKNFICNTQWSLKN